MQPEKDGVVLTWISEITISSNLEVYLFIFSKVPSSILSPFMTIEFIPGILRANWVILNVKLKFLSAYITVIFAFLNWLFWALTIESPLI